MAPRSTPTPSRVDVLLDDVQCSREDALGIVYEAQHAAHNAMTAHRAVWEALGKLADELAGADEHDNPGPMFRALSAIREEPAIRRAREAKAVAS